MWFRSSTAAFKKVQQIKELFHSFPDIFLDEVLNQECSFGFSHNLESTRQLSIHVNQRNSLKTEDSSV